LSENYFKQLYGVDVNNKKKTKNNLNYLSWAACWAEVKKMFPNSTFKIYEEEITVRETVDGKIVEKSIQRPWFDDGNTGWVKTGVTINDIEHIEELPIMDFKNKSIPAVNITSADANKSIQRSLTKACARHGLGLYIYEGEDLPEESKELAKLRGECWKLFCERAKISEEAKLKANKVCKTADPSGDPRVIEDIDVLKTLKSELLGIRK
jgi:hypothetical protein